MTAPTDPVPGAGEPTDGREPPPLSWKDIDQLRPTGRPGWLAREVRWLAFGAGLALVVLFVLVVPTGPCTAATPCGPDPTGALVIGMIGSLPLLALIELGFAAALAGTAVLATLGYEQTQTEHLPVWFHLLFVGYAVVCGLLARLAGPSAWQRSALRHWRPVERAVPPPARLPRPPLVPSVVAATLLVGAIVLAGWSTLRQNAVDAQQRRAEVSTATVSDHRWPGDVELRFTDGRPGLWIPVIDTADYPVGSTVDVLVDDRGLRQLVSEPYDLSFWLVPTTLLGLAGLGLGWRVRAGMRARRRFFLQPQPLSTVNVDRFGNRVYIYAGSGRDARPVAEIEVSDPLTLTPHVVSDRAVLYGPPVPGHWGTVAIDGRILTPTGPMLPPTPPAPRIGPPLAPPLSLLPSGTLTALAALAVTTWTG